MPEHTNTYLVGMPYSSKSMDLGVCNMTQTVNKLLNMNPWEALLHRPNLNLRKSERKLIFYLLGNSSDYC